MRALSVFILAFICISVNAENIKIGYIDVDFVISNLSKYKKDNESLILKFEPKKLQLLELFNHIELLKNNLKKKESTLSVENFNEEVIKIRDLEKSFQNETDLWQESLNDEKIDTLQKIEILINNAIEDFATNEKYDLILYQNAAYVRDSLNISNKIISKIEDM